MGTMGHCLRHKGSASICPPDSTRVSSCLISSLFLFLNRVSWRPDWPQTCYVGKGDLELLILLPLPFNMPNFDCTGASCMLVLYQPSYILSSQSLQFLMTCIRVLWKKSHKLQASLSGCLWSHAGNPCWTCLPLIRIYSSSSQNISYKNVRALHPCQSRK